MKTFTLLLLLCSASPLFAHNPNTADAAMGISTQHIGPAKARLLDYPAPYGSRISKVSPDSPAEAAGLLPLDYIYKVDGQQVDAEQNLDQLLQAYRPGDGVMVTFLRGSNIQEAQVILARREDIPRQHTPATEDPFLGISQTHYNYKDRKPGVPVQVVHNSTAQAMGLQDGDRLIRIDGYPVLDWHDTSVLVDNRKVGSDIAITVERDGEELSFIRPIKSRAATHGSHSRPNGPQIISPDGAAATLPPIAQPVLRPLGTPEASALDFLFAPAKEEPDLPSTAEVQPSAQGLQLEGLSVTALNIFPNPTTGIFDLQFTLPEKGETAVFIYNPSGQPVYFNTLGLFTGTFSDRIDIANGVRGIYFLEVRQGQQRLVRKVILQ